ncbi:hypothetical protein RHMOL_Rhmol13G0298400 [Rhododendron molle]|uniref:Uncharacterized protein n=1 Tax=Rhododendron molle TaxID=49168 RepID=A0ACC0LD57_RHOML|nr:hypothetical protein RHMOL_Rhmol13G0298400 [Rhododendron molle]
MTEDTEVIPFSLLPWENMDLDENSRSGNVKQGETKMDTTTSTRDDKRARSPSQEQSGGRTTGAWGGGAAEEQQCLEVQGTGEAAVAVV